MASGRFGECGHVSPLSSILPLALRGLAIIGYACGEALRGCRVGETWFLASPQLFMVIAEETKPNSNSYSSVTTVRQGTLYLRAPWAS